MQRLPIIAALALLSVSVSAPAEEFDEAKFDELVKKVNEIVDAEIAKELTPSGFKVSPSQIDYTKSPEYQKLETGSLWKQADEHKGKQYAAKQKEVNDRTRPEAEKFRGDLLDAFDLACELGGGGSASGFLMSMSPAEVEWIIANLSNKGEKSISDAALTDHLKSIALLPEEYATARVKEILEKLHKVEKHLSEEQANHVRKGFLGFFCGTAYTPEPGTEERTAILDVVRKPLQKKISQKKKIKVIFVVEHMKVDGDWAFLKAIPKTEDGGSISYKGTDFEEDAETSDELTVALLKKVDGKWTSVQHDYFTTDVWWEGLWDAHKGCPSSIFEE